MDSIEKEIVKLLPAMTNNIISRKVGCTREYVRQVRNKYNISGPSRVFCSPFWNEEKLSELCALPIEDMTTREIAKKMGCQYGSYLLSKMKEMGLPAPRDSKIKYTEKFIKELYLKHNGNVTSMARELGVKQSGISKKCKQYGLKGIGNKLKRRRTI